MAFDRWRPDIIVGIDFGMTCTGVAYSSAPEWPAPKSILQWPGKSSYELRSKVDTAVSYSAEEQHLIAWGFECDEDDEKAEVNRLFKLHLDPRYKDGFDVAPDQAEVQRWYRDYLAFLYACVMRFFGQTMGQFATKNIEFVFSVPTAWKDPSMIADIERLISEAGYAKRHSQRFSVSLTEAEAAAVYAAKQQMQRGAVFLVCDSGGGTTDLNVLKVVEASAGRMELEPLHYNEGETVGSTIIDHRAEAILTERLARIREELSESPESLARKIVQDRFVGYKCDFGSKVGDLPKYLFPIPGMVPGRQFPHAGVVDSKIMFTHEEMKQLFDEQTDRILRLIDEQLRVVQTEHPSESINYLVLSGGLGSSPYLQARVRDRYERGTGIGLPNSQGITLLIAAEPQLAVVQGLVHAKIQAQRGGPELLAYRRSPVSYGVVCRERWDKRQHQGERVQRDPFDSKRWAEDQIHWFVKRNEKIDVKRGKNQNFRYKIPLGRERDPWHTRIVMSKLPVRDLPQSLRRGDAKIVCKVETQLDRQDMRPRNDKWYHLQKEYKEAEFDVKMLVGPGLQFEVWGKDGIRKSRAHDEIDVEWLPVNETGDDKIPASDSGFAMYRP